MAAQSEDARVNRIAIAMCYQSFHAFVELAAKNERIKQINQDAIASRVRLYAPNAAITPEQIARCYNTIIEFLTSHTKPPIAISAGTSVEDTLRIVTQFYIDKNDLDTLATLARRFNALDVAAVLSELNKRPEWRQGLRLLLHTTPTAVNIHTLVPILRQMILRPQTKEIAMTALHGPCFDSTVREQLERELRLPIDTELPPVESLSLQSSLSGHPPTAAAAASSTTTQNTKPAPRRKFPQPTSKVEQLVHLCITGKTEDDAKELERALQHLPYQEATSILSPRGSLQQGLWKAWPDLSRTKSFWETCATILNSPNFTVLHEIVCALAIEQQWPDLLSQIVSHQQFQNEQYEHLLVQAAGTANDACFQILAPYTGRVNMGRVFAAALRSDDHRIAALILVSYDIPADIIQQLEEEVTEFGNDPKSIALFVMFHDKPMDEKIRHVISTNIDDLRYGSGIFACLDTLINIACLDPSHPLDVHEEKVKALRFLYDSDIRGSLIDRFRRLLQRKERLDTLALDFRYIFAWEMGNPSLDHGRTRFLFSGSHAQKLWHETVRKLSEQGKPRHLARLLEGALRLNFVAENWKLQEPDDVRFCELFATLRVMRGIPALEIAISTFIKDQGLDTVLDMLFYAVSSSIYEGSAFLLFHADKVFGDTLAYHLMDPIFFKYRPVQEFLAGHQNLSIAAALPYFGQYGQRHAQLLAPILKCEQNTIHDLEGLRAVHMTRTLRNSSYQTNRQTALQAMVQIL